MSKIIKEQTEFMNRKNYNGFQKMIPMNKHNKKQLEIIRPYAEAELNKRAQSLPYSEFMRFERTGSRVEYEVLHTLHRKRLNAFVAMALSNLDPKWIDAVEDAVWAICDEFSWALPAHIPDLKHCTAESALEIIDLFAAGTGFALSEIYYLLGDRLSDVTCSRIKYEVRRRIIQPYKKARTDWGASNWSAVCAGGVIASVIYVGTKEDFDDVINSVINSLNVFLTSYHDDGCCLEGVLYQAYGFGNFCYAAELIREYTDGAIDLFQSEKVRKIAEFSQYAYLSGNICIPFADAPHNYNYNIGLCHFLAKKFDTVTVPSEEYEVLFGDDYRHRFNDFIRNFYWYDENLKCSRDECSYKFFEDAQWYVRKNRHFAFAAKGGNNEEPHNHNDVGSFVVLHNGKHIIDDLGWPEYDSSYGGETRYDKLCASSRGHGVPIVNGEYQRTTDKNARIISAAKDEFILDIANAYEGIKSLVRSFKISDDSITVKDSSSDCNFTERLVTREKPIVCGSEIRIADCIIKCKNAAKITVNQEEFEPRMSICKMDMKEVETAYLIDIEPQLCETGIDIVITVWS